MLKHELNQCQEWIEFDIPSIVALRKDYSGTMDFIKDELPDVNWESRIETKDYFSSTFGIFLDNTTVSTLKSYQSMTESFSEKAHFVLTGLIEYYKLKYTIRNYLDNILKHNVEGVVNLRRENNQILMPNKRPLPTSPSITECIKNVSLNLTHYLKENI